MTDPNDPLSAPKRTTAAPQPEPVDPLLEDDKPPYRLSMPKFFVPAVGTVVGLFVLLFLAGLAVPLFVDFNALRDKVLAEVQKSTGFEVKLADQIDFSLMPFPKVGVHDVVVRHPQDDPDSPLLKAKDVTVSVGLAGLLAGKVNITKVDVNEAAVNLRELAEGRNNWTPATQETKEAVVEKVSETQGVSPQAVLGGEATADAAEPETAAKGPAVSLDEVELSDVKLVYTPLSGAASDVRIDNGTVGLSEFDGPFDVTIKGAAMQERLPIDLTASVGKLTGTTEPSDVKVDFKTDAGTIKLDGDIILGAAPQYNGKTDIALDDLPAFLKALDPKSAGAPIKKFGLKGDVTASAKSVSIKDGDIVLDEAKGPFNLTLEGLGSDTMSGQISTKLDVANWALAKGFKEIAAQGQFSKQGVATRIAPLDLTVDGQSVTGAIATGPGGSAVNLTSQKLDLTPLLKAFDVKDVPAMVLNGIALDGAMMGNQVKINKLTVQDVQGLTVAATGAVGDLSTGAGTVANVKINSQNLLQSLKQFPQVTVPKEAEKFLDQPGSATASYNGTFDAGNLSAAIQAMGGSAGVKTGISNLKTKAQIGGLTFVLSHPNTNSFLGMVSPGTKLGPAFNGPMNIQAGVEQNGDTFNVNNLDAKLGGTTLAGNLVVKTGDVASVSGNLQTGAIDIAQWFGAKETGAKTSAREKGQSPLLVMAATGGASGGKWTSTPIDFSWMNTLALDLSLNAAQLKSDPWVVVKPSLNVKLSGGKLTISDLTGGFLGGTIKGNVDAANNGGTLTAKATVNADNVNLDPLTRNLVKTGKIVDGIGNLDLNVSTSGSSSLALMKGLNGTGTVKGTNLVIHGLNVDSIVDTVYSVEENDWTGALGLVGSNFRDGSSQFSDATIPITITNGVATWPETTLKSTRTDVITQGTLDFPQWIVNVQNKVVVTTKENRRIDALQISTTGSLDNPQTKTDSSALTDKLKNRATKLIEKKIPDQYKGLVGGLLGTNTGEEAAPTPTPAPTTTTTPAETAPTVQMAPVMDEAPAATTPAPVVEPTPATPAAEPAPASAAPEPEPAATPEEQIINGVINGVLGQ